MGHVERHGSLTVNVGSTEETTVRELAERTIELSGKEIALEFDASRPTGALNRMPDLERVKRVLGWGPTTTFAKGLERTYEWAEGRISSGADRMD
jgi:GDP-L-fucose synthase